MPKTEEGPPPSGQVPAAISEHLTQLHQDLSHIHTAVRQDAYKRGFLFGVIFASTFILAAFVARTFFGL